MYTAGDSRALAGNNASAYLCERGGATQGDVRSRPRYFGDHVGDTRLFALKRVCQSMVAHLLILSRQGPCELQLMS